MRRPRFLVLALLSVLGLSLVSGCRRLDSSAAPDGDGATAGENSAELAVLVRLGAFEIGEISTRLSVPADLEAVDEADFYPEVTGIIHEIRKREGDVVEKDEAIVLLGDEELRLAKETKELVLEDARTKQSLAAVAVKEGESTIEQKMAVVEQSNREYDRANQLLEDEGIVSPEAMETKLYAKKKAEGELNASRLALERLKLEEEQAASTVKQAAKDLETAAFKLSRTVLRSPIAGHISFLEHKKGELVSPSSLVFAVVNVERLQARVHVPQRELGRLRVGQRVEITCSVFPGEVFSGTVDVINPVIDKEKGTARMIVDVQSTPQSPDRTDPVPRLKPGMFIDADVVTATHSEALLVDKRAVIYDNRQPVVFLVSDGKARRCIVTPGFSRKDRLEVRGLTIVGESADSEDEILDISRRLPVEGASARIRRVELSAGRLVLVGQNKLKHLSPVQVETARLASPSPGQAESE